MQRRLAYSTISSEWRDIVSPQMILAELLDNVLVCAGSVQLFGCRGLRFCRCVTELSAILFLKACPDALVYICNLCMCTQHKLEGSSLAHFHRVSSRRRPTASTVRSLSPGTQVRSGTLFTCMCTQCIHKFPEHTHTPSTTNTHTFMFILFSHNWIQTMSKVKCTCLCGFVLTSWTCVLSDLQII